MASSESPNPSGDEFYVLKQGGMHGPFTRADLQARFNEGILAMEDFVQAEGVPIWQPLGRVLGSEETIPHGAIAPDWKSLLTWVWLRLRFDLDEKSVVSGWVCLGVGLLALFLSHWTFIFWLPWMIAAIIASLALWQRRRFVAGALLLAAAIVLPLLFFTLEPKPKPDLVPTIEEKMETPAKETETPGPQAVIAPPVRESAPPVVEQRPARAPEPAPEINAPLIAEPAAAPMPAEAIAPAAAPLLPDPATPVTPVAGGDFVQQHRNALVVVKGRISSGRCSKTFRLLWTWQRWTTAPSPHDSRSALRNPVPPSMMNSAGRSRSRPRCRRSASNALHTVAFSVVPSRRPRTCFTPCASSPRTMRIT